MSWQASWLIVLTAVVLAVLVVIGGLLRTIRKDDEYEQVFETMRRHPSTGPHPSEDFDDGVRVMPRLPLYDYEQSGDFGPST